MYLYMYTHKHTKYVQCTYMHTKRAAIKFAPHSNSAYIIVCMAFHSHVCVHACAAALTESERSGDTLGQSAPQLDLCGLVGHRDKEPPELGHERREGERERGREGEREEGGREGEYRPCHAVHVARRTSLPPFKLPLNYNIYASTYMYIIMHV